ncbi:MAG: leucine-rich repeat domain-containing protein [Bacteroidales bacterium]|nr:leucine-rich repeat domain-containing protein [Bacteroidales bacterium]
MKKIINILVAIIVLASLAIPTTSLHAQRDKVYKSLSEVRNPDSVYILRLRYKRMKTIPAKVFTFKNLRVLDLSRNFIDSIPPEIASLTNLEELNVRRNRIRVVPPEVGKLVQLRILDMSRNPILELPDEMSALTRLEELTLWCTGIVSFPPSFVTLNETLRVIDLRVCPLTYDDQQAIEELLPNPRKRWDYVCNCQ